MHKSHDVMTNKITITIDSGSGLSSLDLEYMYIRIYES
jgi:hypothetical protein